MTTVRGSVTKCANKVDTAGTYIEFMLQPQQGQSTPVVWRGPTTVAFGQVLEATGELNSDGYLLAVSVKPLDAPKPVPQKKLYFIRAFGSSFLGDLLAYIAVIILARSAGTAAQLFVLVIFGISFSAGFSWKFAPGNRPANAALGGAMAVLIPLFFYLAIYSVLRR